jgi:phosphoglycerate kinase
MPKIENIHNSTVLVRADLNLPSLEDIGRVTATLPTINLLLENQNKVVLISHWGRPKGVDLKWSLEQMTSVLSQQIGKSVEFVNQYKGSEQAKQHIEHSDNQIFLLENTRFEPREKSKNKKERKELAQQYAILGDYFVDEAFAVSHRQEATNTELKKMLPHVLGLNYEQEVEHLDKIKYHAKHPYIVIISGAKLETKLPLIEKFLDKANHIMIAGLICFTFIEARRQLFEKQNDEVGLEHIPDIKDSPIEEDFLPKAVELLKKYEHEIVLPCDFQYYTDEDGSELAYDIGPKTVRHFGSLLKHCDTVFWNGPLGVYEIPPYDTGTIELAKILAEDPNCYTVTGGGDINSAVPAEYLDKFAWISTGGGATLDYLSRD